MLYVVHCVDKPNHQQVRADTREAHLAYLKKFHAQMLAAGPTLSYDGATPTGSLLIIDFPDRAAVEAFAREDPYAKAGLSERMEIKPWKKVLP